MHDQHLSDEAIAAFADGVLSGGARERALRHTKACGECNYAVAEQREAVWALRAAPAPALPTGLMERLRGLPEITPITIVPTVFDHDGTPMMSVMAPVAALVPSTPSRHTHKMRTAVGAAAAIAAVGVLAAGSGRTVLPGNPSHRPQRGVPVRFVPGTGPSLAMFVDSGRPGRP